MEYEADPKHANIIVENAGVPPNKVVSTPGVDERAVEDQTPEGEEMSPEQSSRYRADAARANFLGIDRPDVQFAAKEISKSMAQPRLSDNRKIIRLAKYLNHEDHKRLVQVFSWGNWEPKIEVWTDSDWAGCKATRKSTSGGVI